MAVKQRIKVPNSDMPGPRFWIGLLVYIVAAILLIISGSVWCGEAWMTVAGAVMLSLLLVIMGAAATMTAFS